MPSIQAGVPRFGTRYYVGIRRHLGNWLFNSAPLTSWVSSLTYVVMIMLNLAGIIRVDSSEITLRFNFIRWNMTLERINIEIHLLPRET